MENGLRIIYDEENIQDVRIEFDELSDIKGSIKIFCVDTLPEDLNVQVEEDENGNLIIKSDDGEKTLTHILKFMYLTTRLAMKAGDKMTQPGFKVEDLDLSIINEDIDKVQNADYKTLNLLISDLDENNGTESV